MKGTSSIPEFILLGLARHILLLALSTLQTDRDLLTSLPRKFVEDWVAAEEQKAARQRHRTLVWTIVGGVAGVAYVLEVLAFVSIGAGSIVIAILKP